MDNNEQEKLLSDRRVVEEINRHLWLESEKAGRNIGFEQAKEDWLKKFSKAWIEYHMPEKPLKSEKETTEQPAAKKDQASNAPSLKRRRAKSYIITKV